jgi:hypothetical protein
MGNFVTKDSGARVEFPTGSRRDTSEGKWRVDLIWVGFLVRLGDLLARGAKKYDVNNWQLGQPIDRSYQSALRHLLMWKDGETSEDHLAAVCFNIMSIMYVAAKVKLGNLPMTLMMALDKDGNATDKYFECADMPTPALQNAIAESNVLEKLQKRYTAIQTTVVIMLAREGFVKDNYLSSLNYPASDVNIVLSRLVRDGFLAPASDKFVLASTVLPYTEHMLRVLVSMQGRPITYKYLRDRVENALICEGVHTFEGYKVLDAINNLVSLKIVETDAPDGNYRLP